MFLISGSPRSEKDDLFRILFLSFHNFNPVTAIEMSRELAPFKTGWVEEPVPPENLAALRKAAAASAPLGIPVATGERLHTPYDYRELVEQQAADIIQPDITHFGGALVRVDNLNAFILIFEKGGEKGQAPGALLAGGWLFRAQQTSFEGRIVIQFPQRGAEATLPGSGTDVRDFQNLLALNGIIDDVKFAIVA